MAELSRSKSAQLIGIGVILTLLSTGLFALLYIIHGDKYEFGKSDVFDKNTAFWAVIPITVAGLVGVLAGILKTITLIRICLATSLVSTCLSCVTSIGYGLKVTSIRTGCGEDSTCKNSDTAVLLGTIVLLSGILLAISLMAVVKACQALWGPSKNQNKKRYVSTAQYSKSTSGGTSSKTVKVIVTSQSTCHACGGIVNPAVNNVDEQHDRSSGYDTNGSTNHGSDDRKLQPLPSSRVEVIVQNTVNDDGTETAKDDGTHSLGDGSSKVNQLEKDDVTINTTKDSDDTGAVKDDGPYYTTMDDDVSQSEKDLSTSSTAKDGGTNSTAKDDGTDSTAKDDGTNSTTKDDGTNSIAKDDGLYYSVPDPMVDIIVNQTVKDGGSASTGQGNQGDYSSLDDNTRIYAEYETLDNTTRNILQQQQQEKETNTQENQGYEDDEELSTSL